MDLGFVDNLTVIFYFIFFIIRKGHTCQNSFPYNYLKTIQVDLVHISETYCEVLQGFDQKNVSKSIIICICSKIDILLFNVFILKSKDPSMDPSSTPYSVFDHMLKDNFILVLSLRSTK